MRVPWRPTRRPRITATALAVVLVLAILLGFGAGAGLGAAAYTPTSIRIPSLQVLVPIYTEDMDAAQVDRIENGIELARLFYWRNSACRLDLQLTFMRIAAEVPSTSGTSYAAIEADLRARGVSDNQYDAVFTVGNGIENCWGGFVILGMTGAAYAGGSCGAPYPGNDPSINYTYTWAFTHEFGHVLDLVIARLSGRPEMLFNHFPWIYPLPAGEVFDAGAHYDGMSEVLRRFHAYDQFRAPWNGYLTVDDADRDGFPDGDARLAMDEVRFGSSTSSVDSDLDGRRDLAEFTAGIFAGSDPRKEDTDGDGWIDGRDRFPLDRVEPAIARGAAAPVVDGELDAGWPLLASGLRYTRDPSLTASLYGTWDDGFLYLAVVSSREVDAYVSIDASPQNGRFESDALFAGSGGSVETNRGDCWGDDAVICATSRERTLRAGADAITGGVVATGWAGRDRVLELAIPSLLPPGAPYAWTATAEIAAGDELAGIAHAASGPHATGLTLADGRRLGLAVTLTEPSRAASGEFSGSWASFFEPYRYHDLELAAEAATLAAAPDQSVRRLEFRSAVPNPTPGATEFQFVVPGGAADAASATELTVFDVNGRLTRTLVARALSPGSHEVRWDGRDSRGADVPAGVYYVRLAAGKDVVTRKLTIVR